jgi:hypothetical protein
MDTTTQLALDLQIPEQPAVTRPPINQRLQEAARPDMVQVAPGRWAPRPGRKAPDMTLATWQQNADGTYTPTPMTERMVKLTRKLTTLLGFPGQFETIRRLGRAGYVECIKLTPHIYMLNLDSWFGHMRRCAEDPDFWDADGKNLRAYRQAQGWIERDTRKEASGRKTVLSGRKTEDGRRNAGGSLSAPAKASKRR